MIRFLLLGVLWLLPVHAEILLLPGAVPVSSDYALQDLARARVIYLGETHDQPGDHVAQARIIEALSTLDQPLVIGMEMFQRPFQIALDRYLAGEIDEETLQKETDYAKRWGFSWEFYAPVLRLAKAKKIPVLALNTPVEATRKVAKGGLTALDAEDLTFLPPLDLVPNPDPEYRAYLKAIYEGFHQGAAINLQGLERFIQAQQLWDATMAYHLTEFLNQYPDHRAVVLVGQGHVIYNYGLPNRVATRLKALQRTVVFGTPTDQVLKDPQGQPLADYLWATK